MTTRYELLARETAQGFRGWHLYEDVAGEGWDEIAVIGGMPTEDARDWAATQITHEDNITWTSGDGTVFSDRWTTETDDPWFDEE